MKRRVISIILTVVMILSVFPAALAAGGDQSSSLLLHFMSHENGQVIECESDNWRVEITSTVRVRVCLHSGDSSVPVDPNELELPPFFEIVAVEGNGWFMMHANGLGSGVISYNGKSVRVSSVMPDLGLYSAMPFSASTLMDEVTVNGENTVFYIALSSERVSEGLSISAVNYQLDPEIRNENITECGLTEVFNDANGSYVKVTLPDANAKGNYHFEALMAHANSSGVMRWGRGIEIVNNLPGLWFCHMEQMPDRWVPDYNSARPDFRMSPGYDHIVTFFYGTEEEVRAGIATPIPLSELSFPAYITAEEMEDHERDVPANTLLIKFNRFATGNEPKDISYNAGGRMCTMPTETVLPSVGFYTTSSASKASYVYDAHPFEITNENRSVYICTEDVTVHKLVAVTRWHGEEIASSFNQETAPDGSYIKLTLKDGAAAPTGRYGVELMTQRLNNGKWVMENDGTTLAIKNTLPSLYWCHVEKNEATGRWEESNDREIGTALYISGNDDFPIQISYGTEGDRQKLGLEDITYSSDVFELYKHDGALWIKPVVYEGNGFISYTGKDGNTVRMLVRVNAPDFGFYSAPAANASNWLGDTVVYDPANNKTSFFLVAGQDRTIDGISAIMSNFGAGNQTDKFGIQLSVDGSHAIITISGNAAGELPAGGRYTIEIDQPWGIRYLHFDLVRMDLEQLSTPTDLTWHKQYWWNWEDVQKPTDYFTRMGNMSFKVGELSQNHFDIEVYTAADGYRSAVVEGRWEFGSMDHADYFSLSDFIYARLPSGTYKFRVRASGDGTKYRDSEWSALSEAWTYTEPTAQMTAPDSSKFEWTRAHGMYNAFWISEPQEGAGYYEVQWYIKDDGGNLRQVAGSFDMDVWEERWEEEGAYPIECGIEDFIIQEHGNVYFWFRVRTIPKDITAYRVSEWSAFSEPLEVEEITDYVNNKLDTLLPGSSGGASVTVQDVQDALAKDTADLRTAMNADLSQSGGSTGTLEKIKELEKAVADNVEQKVEAKNSAPSQIKEIASGIEMIGATLNFEDKNSGNGKPASVTLEIDEPKSGVVIPEQQHNSVQFSMKLKGAVNHEDHDQAHQQLIVPIVIDMPVPTSINPDFLVVLHKLENGQIEQMRPNVYWSDAEGRWRATFVIDSFSDFAFVEYDFRFDVETVTKSINDENFTIAPVGNAQGSQIIYESSNEAVAVVDEMTGEVTIVGGGTAVITAYALATDIYPEAEASYTLTVETSGGFPGESMPPVYIEIPGQITVSQSVNGTLTLSSLSAVKGEIVLVDVTPAKGYKLEKLIVTDLYGKSVDVAIEKKGQYKFRMPGSDVKVEVVFTEIKASFTDVGVNEYFFEAVAWAVENGITTGLSDPSLFGPHMVCSRAQAVTFLWRAAGCPEPKGTVKGFTDVAADEYYYKAVLWAAEMGITTGTGNGTTFSPDEVCSRAQIVTFLWRSQGAHKVSSANSFTDVAPGAFCADAVQWAVANSITTGTGNGTTFSPDEYCSRAQIVTFLFRYFGDK